MIYKDSSNYTCLFLTANSVTKESQNADTLPIAIAMKNGLVDDNFELVVTNVNTGVYKITGTIPSYSIGDRVDIIVTAIIDGVIVRDIVDSFKIDSHFISDVISKLGEPIGLSISEYLNNITLKVNSIPTNPLLTDDIRLVNLNLISQIPNLTAVEVWEYNNRTLSNFGIIPKNIIDDFIVVVGANRKNITLIPREDGTMDIIAKQGTTWNIFCKLKIDEDNPLPITNYIFKGQMRTHYGAPTSSLDFEPGIIDSVQGGVVYSASASITKDVKAYKTSVKIEEIDNYKGEGVYVYDFKAINDYGNVARVLEGRIIVDPEVTKI